MSVCRIGLVVLLLTVPACVELCSQRIVMHHEKAADRLQVLLFYDGVHTTEALAPQQDEGRVREFAKGGDIMLLDWPLIIEGDELPGWARDSVKVESMGTHRDPFGRLGVTQRVTIEKVSSFLERANRAIDAEITGLGDRAAEPAWRRSTARLREAAGRGKHAWLALEGHALWIDLPLHLREWQAAKALGVGQLAEELAGMAGKPDRLRKLVRVLQSLQSIPAAVVESSAGVRVRLGLPDRPVPFRIQLNEDYNPVLERTLHEVAPAPVDASPLPAWAPFEIRAGGLIDRAATDDAAAGALEAAGTRWNGTESLPRAPARAGDRGAWLSDWQRWRKAVFTWPVTPR